MGDRQEKKPVFPHPVPEHIDKSLTGIAGKPVVANTGCSWVVHEEHGQWCLILGLFEGDGGVGQEANTHVSIPCL